MGISGEMKNWLKRMISKVEDEELCGYQEKEGAEMYEYLEEVDDNCLDIGGGG